MATVAIVGGGISGLSCAHYLKALGGTKIRYLFLVDKKPTFGGWIQTTRFPDNAIFDHGPRTLRMGSKSGYNALLLAEELGLTSRILPIDNNNKYARTNFVLHQNELHPLPRNFTSILTTKKPLNKPIINYLYNEFKTKGLKLEDESVYNFTKRRFGQDIAEYIVDPLCRGISAGDCRELSVKSMFPYLYEMESKYGSVVKGTLFNRENVAANFMHSKLITKARNEFWKMWTLKTGMSELVDALACSIEKQGERDLLFNTECLSLRFNGNKAEVEIASEIITVDHVFCSVPAYQFSRLINHDSLKIKLNKIPFVDVAVVYLEYENDVLPVRGFGFLTPSREDAEVMGIVFDSCCFPMMNGNSKTRLTCMLGGKWFKDIFGNVEHVSKEVVLQKAIEGARKHLGIKEKPVRNKVIIQRKCIPQYLVGHQFILEDIEKEINQNNMCLSIIGASYKGAGVPDCIYNAKQSVENFLKTL